MKHAFVKTENHRRFMAAVAMLGNRGAMERCILPVTGKPGVGKTRVVDNWGSEVDAVFLEGIPGMSLRYVRDALKAETGVTEKSSFAEFAALVEFFKNGDGHPHPIILDECQHGFPNKAECIEYLRRLAEKAGTILVIVCHDSEAHLLKRHEHIKTRLGGACEMLPPSLEDTSKYTSELCEVGLEFDLVTEIHRQSKARYRLIADAVSNVERIAGKLGRTNLSLADVAGMSLCQDWEDALQKKVESKKGSKANGTAEGKEGAR